MDEANLQHSKFMRSIKALPVLTEAQSNLTSTGLLVANDFLTHKTKGDDVYKTVVDACKLIQCCEGCLRSVRNPIMSNTECVSTCLDCLAEKAVCQDCTEHHQYIYQQLRACSRCIAAGIKCYKLAVLGITMDCESNNAHAMHRILSKQDLDRLRSKYYAIECNPRCSTCWKKGFQSPISYCDCYYPSRSRWHTNNPRWF